MISSLKLDGMSYFLLADKLFILLFISFFFQWETCITYSRNLDFNDATYDERVYVINLNEDNLVQRINNSNTCKENEALLPTLTKWFI